MTSNTAVTVLVCTLALVAFVVFVAAQNAPSIRAWVDRYPARLDDELAHKYRGES